VSWYAIEVQPPDHQRDVIAAWLVQHTGQAIEERADGTLVSFALDLAGADSLESELLRSYGIRALRLPLPEVDWSTAWRQGLGPRRVGRFVIVPTWLRYDAEPGDEVIVLDPEMAFGSGEHGSTRGALALLEQWLPPQARVIDLGSGSAILAIAAARLGARQVTGVELDPDAMSAAQQNVEQNHAAAAVRLMQGDAAILTPLLAPVEVIVSNILRNINTLLLPGIHAALVPGGRAIFAGMEAGERELFLGALRQAGFAVLEEVIDEGWWSVAARRAG
jgi:ribosomal protein L11 methyltransferase